MKKTALPYKKLRLWASYPFAALYLALAAAYGVVFYPGIWVVAAGLGMRFWAAGYIRKTRVLATNGPYAFVRNPLYVGNFLMGLGFCLFINHALLVIVYCGMFYIVYRGTVIKEEAVLEKAFGEDYRAYKHAVQAFWPRLTPYRIGTPVSFSLSVAHANGELIRIVVTGILLSLLYIFYHYGVTRMLDTGDCWRAALLVLAQAGLLAVTIQDRKKYSL